MRTRRRVPFVRRLAACCAASAVICGLAPSAVAQLDETWTVTVNGQNAQVSPDGSYRISNISSPDRSPRDLLSDDFFRVRGFSTAGGVTRYAYSDLFQLRRDETYVVDALFVTTQASGLFLETLRLTTDRNELAIGETAALTVTGVLLGGAVVDLTAPGNGTTYRSSNPVIARVDDAGSVTAVRRGTAFITATNEGIAGVVRIDVVQPEILTTVEGFVQRPDAAPIDGATITTTAFAGQTSSDETGFFSVELSVPPDASVTVSVTANDGGLPLTGRSETVPAVADGVTDVGVVTLTPPQVDRLFDSVVIHMGGGPRAVLLRDLNLDGHLDLVTAGDGFPGDTRVRLGNGDGTFKDRQDYGSGQYTHSVAAGRLNNDEFPDLVSVKRFDEPVAVMLNNGPPDEGTFADPVIYAGNEGGSNVALGDLNGDGYDDVVTHRYNEYVEVFLNNGDGTLAATVSYPVGYSRNAGPCTRCDTCVDCSDGWEDGCAADPSFVDCPDCETQSRDQIVDVAIADVDEDSIPDVVVATQGRLLSVLRGHGDGTLGRPLQFLSGACTGSTGGNPYVLAVGDLNHDDHVDIVVGDGPNTFRPFGISVLLGNGDGTFGEPVSHLAGPTSVYGLALDDVTLDGHVDIVAINTYGASVSVLPGNGDGTFEPLTLYGGGHEGYDVAVGDVDEDGAPDIAYTSHSTDDVRLLFNDGAGVFSPLMVLISARDQIEAVAVADLDDDTSPDFVITEQTGVYNPDLDEFESLIYVVRSGPQVIEPYAVALRPIDVVAGDLNGDDWVDLGVVHAEEAQALTILLNDGDGGFTIAGNYPVSAFNPTAIAMADVDLDGDPDIAVSNYHVDDSDGFGSVSIFLNNGDGTFGSDTQVFVGRVPYAVLLVDLNRDDLPEIVTADQGDDEVSVVFNVGDGQFGKRASYDVERAPWDVATGDFNGDGHVDLASAHRCESGGEINVLYNTGDGTFDNDFSHDTGACPEVIEAVDIDGDGDVDILTTSTGYFGTGGQTGLTVLRNDGTGRSFVQDVHYLTGLGATDLDAADADLDGDLDLIIVAGAVGSERGGVTIHLNRTIP